MKHLFLKMSVCTSFCLLAGAPSHVQGARPPEQFDPGRIDSYLSAQVQEKSGVGLSVAIVKNGQIALAKTYGSRSLKEQLPVELDTQFASGSVTKQFTCACALLLAQDGRLSVRDKVSKYFLSTHDHFARASKRRGDRVRMWIDRGDAGAQNRVESQRRRERVQCLQCRHPVHPICGSAALQQRRRPWLAAGDIAGAALERGFERAQGGRLASARGRQKNIRAVPDCNCGSDPVRRRV